MKEYVGWYKNDQAGAGIKMEVKDKKLFINTSVLVAQSENTFENGQSLIEINKKNRTLNIISKTDTVPYSKVENGVVNRESCWLYRKIFFNRNQFHHDCFSERWKNFVEV